MGLLSRVSSLDLNKELTFSVFLNKYSINFFALFELIDNEYIIVNSMGFDGASIIESSSTPDFWNGIFKDNTVCNFTTSEDINSLLQFFSFKIKDDVKTISIVKITDSKILLICNNSISEAETFISDFNHIKDEHSISEINSLNNYISKNSYLYKLQIDFNEAVETYLLSKKCNSKKEIFTSALLNELQNRITFLYNYPNASLKLNDSLIKTVFICDTKTSKDLLISHLILNLKEVLGSSAEIIDFSFDGEIETFNELKEYLQ